MNIKALHKNFKLPTKGSEHAGAYDLYMPEAGAVFPADGFAIPYSLGFAAEVPENHVALILPRSGKGCKEGLALNNTVGVIDSDYRGEWVAWLRAKNDQPIAWGDGDRLLQMLIVPVVSVELNQVEELSDTDRGEGGFGSTGVK